MAKKIDDRRREQVLSPWVTLVTHSVRLPNWDAARDFHSLKQADYVAMFAVTGDGSIPLVRQYRCALGRFTLELPSGLRDAGEDPRQTAIRELYEETGYAPGAEVTLLGCSAPDVGRLENASWCYFTSGAVRTSSPAWQAEPEVESLLVSREELKRLILSGEFCDAPHIACVMLAVLQGCFGF
jgi:ADP-ribose pyrophosphatase